MVAHLREVLDVKGLRCPLPVLKAHKVLSGLASGCVLDVITTDADAPADLRAYCQNSGNEWLGCQERDDDEGHFFIVSVRRC